MKGIILAGGSGTRLRPITLAISKQLIPIYNKPLIYYPLSTLMLAGIKEILVITSPDQEVLFQRLLGDGKQFGIHISYTKQELPNGIPSGLMLGKEFAQGDSVALILGDNFFYGQGLGRSLKFDTDIKKAKIFLKEVVNTKDFGVMEFTEDGSPFRIIEKPLLTSSNLAITGFYLYPNSVFEKIKELKISKRGETEISDLNNSYLAEAQIEYKVLPRSTVWLDTGTFEGIHQASEFVRVIENQQGTSVGDPVEVAKLNGWIN